MTVKNEVQWLQKCAKIAQQIDPHAVTPNPRVGCVVVRNGQIIASGVHEKWGNSHAEQNALKGLSQAEIADATVYISLEPCAEKPYKKTPACSHLLGDLKPKRVVCGSLDPLWNGQNIDWLNKNRVPAEYISEPSCEKISPFFMHGQTTKRAWVTLRMAQSLNGKATNPHERWTSCPESRRRVHILRSLHAGILTTTGTVLADDCHLNTRLQSCDTPYPASDAEVIVLGKRKINPYANVLKYDRKVHSLPKIEMEQLPVWAYENGINSLMTECGSRAAGSFLAADVVDEIITFVAPNVYGSGLPWFSDFHGLDDFTLTDAHKCGDDVLLRYVKKAHLPSPWQRGTIDPILP